MFETVFERYIQPRGGEGLQIESEPSQQKRGFQRMEENSELNRHARLFQPHLFVVSDFLF